MVAINKSRHIPEIVPRFHCVPIRFRTSLRLHLAKKHSLRIAVGHTSPRMKLTVISLVQILNSLVAAGLTLSVTFLSQRTVCAKEYQHFLHFCESSFFGLEPYDVTLGLDVVLHVVPIRDDQFPVQPPPEFSAYLMNIPGTALSHIDGDDFRPS